MAWKNSWAAVTRSEFSGCAPPYWARAKSSSRAQYAETWLSAGLVVGRAVAVVALAARGPRGTRRRGRRGWCRRRPSHRPPAAGGPSSGPPVPTRVRAWPTSSSPMRWWSWCRSARRSGSSNAADSAAAAEVACALAAGVERESRRFAARRSAPVSAGRARCRSRSVIVRSVRHGAVPGRPWPLTHQARGPVEHVAGLGPAEPLCCVRPHSDPLPGLDADGRRHDQEAAEGSSQQGTEGVGHFAQHMCRAGTLLDGWIGFWQP